MKPSNLQNQFAVALFILGAFAATSLADDSSTAGKSDSKPADAQMAAMMEQMARPGENHKILAGLVGSWKYTMKFWVNPDPNAPPMEYAGKSVIKPVMEGRYFQSESTGQMDMPGPDGKLVKMEFKGMGIDGYDNVKKKFVSSWIDNMGTGITRSEGDYDPATKTINYAFEEELMPGMKSKVREIVKLTDNDHYSVEFFGRRGGQEVKTMEIDFTRK